MRRLQILFFWLFQQKHNVSFAELLTFLRKPVLRSIASRYINQIEAGREFYKITYHNLAHSLYWPAQFPTDSVYQVTAETFDNQDWHYYQKEPTRVQTGEVLLDVGTAEGLFPLTVVEQCRKIILVEPHPLLYRALQQTFAGFSNKVEIIHSAAGNQRGELYFQGGSLTGHLATTAGDSGEKVPVNKIDDLVSPDQRITYLKADIEGFELPMLQGAAETIRRNKPKIAITTYHNENDPKAIIDFLTCLVPEYKYYEKGIAQYGGKPVMIHFWV
jgi:FkbM family methyltransferase